MGWIGGLKSGIGDIMWFFLFLSGLRRKIRISIYLSDEVIDEVERRRGLVKRSTYYESLIRKALDLEPEESPRTTMKKQRQTCLF